MPSVQQLQQLRAGHPELRIDWLDSVDSTQTRVRPNSILISEQQTAGVGRRGKQWLTPAGQAICFSYRFNLPLTARQMHGYALMIGLSIIQTMRRFDPDTRAGLKWPNDLYVDGHKFGGILINLHSLPEQALEVTVGIGINWSLSEAQLAGVDQPVCNIPLAERPDRAAFINQLICRIKTNSQLFVQRGWPAFLNDWLPVDVLLDQLVNISTGDERFQGLCQGVDEQGQLLVLIDGRMNRFSGGEVSVRAI